MDENNILIKYVKEIHDFEEYINGEKKKINKEYHNEFFGYLINLEEYEKLKTEIKYEKNLKLHKNIISSPMNTSQIKKFTLEEIKFRDSNYLLNMIFNGNKYILINKSFWKFICKEDRKNIQDIKFDINYYQIKFKLDDGKELIFKNERNFIISNYYSELDPEYSLYSSNYYSINDNIYDKILKYFEFEKNFKEKLQVTNQKNTIFGYLVDIDWFNKWEKCYCYLDIKSNFLELKKPKKEIVDFLISLKQMNKLNIESLEKPKIYSFHKKEEFDSIIKEKKLIMVNESLISAQGLNNEKSYCYLYNNKIELNFSDKQKITIEAKDNIISIKSGNKDEFPNALQIGKIICYRKILKNLIQIDKCIPVILIKKDIIKEYISKYSDANLLNGIKREIKDKDFSNLQEKIKKILNHLETYNVASYKEILKREKSAPAFNFIGNEYNLTKKQGDLKGKILSYISDFEIINEDIYNFFKENKIIQEGQIMKGEILANNGKIILVYCYNNSYYSEIVSFDEATENIKLEYVLEESFNEKEMMISYLKSDIKTIFENFRDNEISLGTNLKLNFHKIDISIDSQYNNDNNANDNYQNKIIDIVSTLMHLRLFEKDVLYKLELSKKTINNLASDINSNPLSTTNYKLINGKFLAKIKETFHYKIIIDLMKKNDINEEKDINNENVGNLLKQNQHKNYLKFLEKQKNEFMLINGKSKELVEIEKTFSDQNGYKFYYPMAFNIISENIFDKFSKTFEMESANNKPEEMIASFNRGNLAFSGLNDIFCDNNMSLFYLYSYLYVQESGNLNYYPEAILDFKNKENLLKQFSSIMKEDILYNLMNTKDLILLSYKCKVCLIFNLQNNNGDSSEIKSPNIYDDDPNKYFNKFLDFSFSFYKNYKDFYGSIGKLQTKNDEMFLINKKYIDEIKLISQFKEIDNTIQNKKELNSYLIKNEIIDIKQIKKYLDKEFLEKFFYAQSFIENLLNEKDFFNLSSKHMHNDQTNDLFYYENFHIINKKLFDLLKKLDLNFENKCIETKVIFSNNKVILFLKENQKYVLNVGKINDADAFEFEYLIQSSVFNSRFDLQKIFEKIEMYGYDYVNKYINKNGKIEFYIGNIPVKAKIHRLENAFNFPSPNIQNNEIVSKNLKAMILIAISQKNNFIEFQKYNLQRVEKVYLMNYNYLMQYKFNEIFSLINNNNIKKLVDQINNPQNPYTPNLLEEIILKLGQSKLKPIDDELKFKDFSKINLEAKVEKILLKAGKKISVYREFILITERVFNMIKNIIFLNSVQKPIDYAYMDGDILAIHDNIEPCIFFGHYNADRHLYNLKYILNFDREYSIKKELIYILKYGIEQYKQEKTIFNEENNKDLISTIYDENSEIGSFYKYLPGISYENVKEGYNYNDIYNKKLELALRLYNYYENFKQKMNQSFSHDEKYFLIKKEIINDVKKDINYNFIIQLLNKAKFGSNGYYNDKKQKIFILKNFPEKYYERFFKSKELEMRIKDYTSPNQISITIPNGKNESVIIYDNFEIIESSIANGFLSGVYETTTHHHYSTLGFYHSSSTSTTINGENYIECSLKDGKVIVNYPKDKFNNNRYVYAIGSLDNENTFKAEYLLIYRKGHAYFEDIKDKLNNYLLSIDEQLKFGPCPLTGKNYEEIGTAIGLNQINSSNIQKIDNNQYPQNGQNGFGQNNNYENKDNYGQNYGGIVSPNDDDKPYPINIKEYNLDSQYHFSKINDCFKIPPLIGLDNIGATCYMNATLQCLCNIPKFVNYFKYNKYLIPTVRSDITYGNNLLSSSFKLLVEKLWPDRLMGIYNNNNNPNFLYGNFGSANKKNESYAPREFKAKISKMNPLFKGVEANDAKDLVNFLIMTLHEELNMADKKTMLNSAINQDQTNQQLMFNLFSQDFVNNNKSIISDLFYGGNYNYVYCQSCQRATYNYQTFFFFVFPLEEVRIFKAQNSFNNNYNYNMNFNNNEVNIYDCFLYDQRINYMMGENAMYCNFCKRPTNTQMQTFISFGPQIIIIILNRGQGIQYKVKINFVEELNLYNFIEHKETGVNYQLIGVITHLGESGMSGHFIAYCKNPISNSWYRFNDSIVSEVNYANFKTEVIDFAMPYLLFYQKVGA